MKPMKSTDIDLESIGIDIDALNKGDSFCVDQLEDMLHERRDTARYGLALLALRDTISRTMKDRGKPATVAIVKTKLRILTDEEAATYNHMTFRVGLRKARRAFERLLTVDTRLFSKDETREHQRNIEVDGKILSAIASERARCRRLPMPQSNGHQRVTPGLPKELVAR